MNFPSDSFGVSKETEGMKHSAGGEREFPCEMEKKEEEKNYFGRKNVEEK